MRPTCHISHTCPTVGAPPPVDRLGLSVTRTTRSTRRSRTLGALLALAVVTTAGAPAVVTVRPGDTLWDLAKEHGTSVRALQQLNDLPGNGAIYVGDRLRVP